MMAMMMMTTTTCILRAGSAGGLWDWQMTGGGRSKKISIIKNPPKTDLYICFGLAWVWAVFNLYLILLNTYVIVYQDIVDTFTWKINATNVHIIIVPFERWPSSWTHIAISARDCGELQKHRDLLPHLGQIICRTQVGLGGWGGGGGQGGRQILCITK